MSHPITSVYGSILVGATHPYLNEESEDTPAGQEFEFSWVIEERELFWTDAKTVHAFKSPLFRLPDVDPSIVNGTSRMELQIEVPPFLTGTSRIPCRFILFNPIGDLIEVILNGNSYVLKNKSDKEGVHFMISADILQKETRKSKFYAYEFHLRISKEEMEWNAFGSVRHPATAVSSPSDDGESVGAANAAAVSNPASAAVLRLPPTMLEEDRVNLTFVNTDQMIVAKKSALCAQSERFREMMNSMVRGNKIRIPPEYSFAAMKEVVRFLQFGFCENWETLIDGTVSNDGNVRMSGIAAAAVWFKIDQLERLADHKRSLMD